MFNGFVDLNGECCFLIYLPVQGVMTGPLEQCYLLKGKMSNRVWKVERKPKILNLVMAVHQTGAKLGQRSSKKKICSDELVLQCLVKSGCSDSGHYFMTHHWNTWEVPYVSRFHQFAVTLTPGPISPSLSFFRSMCSNSGVNVQDRRWICAVQGSWPSRVQLLTHAVIVKAGAVICGTSRSASENLESRSRCDISVNVKGHCDYSWGEKMLSSPPIEHLGAPRYSTLVKPTSVVRYDENSSGLRRMLL